MMERSDLEPPIISSDKSVMSISTSATSNRGKDSQEIRSRLLNKLGIYDAPGGANLQPMTAAQHRRVRQRWLCREEGSCRGSPDHLDGLPLHAQWASACRCQWQPPLSGHGQQQQDGTLRSQAVDASVHQCSDVAWHGQGACSVHLREAEGSVPPLLGWDHCGS